MSHVTALTTPRPAGGTAGRRRVPMTQLVHLMCAYEQLGSHRTTYCRAPATADPYLRGFSMVVGGFVLVAAICAVVGGPVAAGFFGGLALIPLAGAVLCLRRWRRGRGARLDLFDLGLTVCSTGERITAFHWESMQVRQRVSAVDQAVTESECALTLTGPGGTRMVLSPRQFDDPREWSAAIQAAVAAAQLPSVASSVQRGETVHFGGLAVCQRELIFGERFFPWQRIQTLDARGGLVRIKVGGWWMPLVPVETVPNFYVFHEISDRLRMAAGRRSGSAFSADVVSAEVVSAAVAEVPAAAEVSGGSAGDGPDGDGTDSARDTQPVMA